MRPTFLSIICILDLQNGGEKMYVYLDLVVILNFAVDLLIVLGTNRLTGYPLNIKRSALSAAVGGIYAGICILPGLYFLGTTVWRVISLILIASVAFGWSISGLRRGIIFSFISMALGGIAMVIGNGGITGIILSATLTFGMCILGFGRKIGGKEYVPVDMCIDSKLIRLTALKDTGNALKEPLSGENVLVVGPEIARDYLGLSSGDLLDPVGTFERIKDPRMRLIPFNTVGQSTGMLLAIRFDEVRIGGIKSGQVVAFSPNSFGVNSEFQALTGGIT